MAGPFDAILTEARHPVPPTTLPGRNQPCWCGSEVKFKKCHLNRGTQPKGDFFGFKKRTEKASKRGLCLHPNPNGICGKPAISSHTVQRRGGLRAIAESGHVLTTMLSLSNLIKAGRNPTPERIGLKEASTFPGFCAEHDSATFDAIEKEDLIPSPETAFLFYYRALCMELVRKRQALQTIEGLVTMDAGMPIHRQHLVQSMVAASATGLRVGISELEKHKSEADTILLKGAWQSVHYCFVKFDSILPLVTAFAIQHEHDWQGLRLQYLGNMASNLDVVSITVTSYSGASWAIFAWPEHAKTAASFADSFLLLGYSEMAERLVSVCFDLAENNYLDPRWWRTISEVSKIQLSNKILSGVENLHSAEGMTGRAELRQTVVATDVFRSQA